MGAYTGPALESGRPVRELVGEPQRARSTLPNNGRM